MLSLAADIPAQWGIADYRMRLADLDVLDSVLDTVGLSDRARAFIVANMNRIGAGVENLSATLQRADELHLVSGRGLPTDEEDLAGAVAGLPDGLARSVLSGFMRWNNSAETPLGRRTPDEIVDRLLRKLRGGDASDAIESGLALAGQLAAVQGSPAETAAQVQDIVRGAGANPSAYERFAQLIELIDQEPSLQGRIWIDFSLARGIAYYNGIICDVVDSGDVVLGGGGRYDALAIALGGPSPVPALGFAYTLESLLSAMDAPMASSQSPESTLIKANGGASNAAALRKAREIRSRGGIAVLQVDESARDADYSRTITV